MYFGKFSSKNPLTTSPVLAEAHALIRTRAAHYGEDRRFAEDIAAIKEIVAAVDEVVLAQLSHGRSAASQALTHARERLADRRLAARA